MRSERETENQYQSVHNLPLLLIKAFKKEEEKSDKNAKTNMQFYFTLRSVVSSFKNELHPPLCAGARSASRQQHGSVRRDTAGEHVK